MFVDQNRDEENRELSEQLALLESEAVYRQQQNQAEYDAQSKQEQLADDPQPDLEQSQLAHQSERYLSDSRIIGEFEAEKSRINREMDWEQIQGDSLSAARHKLEEIRQQFGAEQNQSQDQQRGRSK